MRLQRYTSFVKIEHSVFSLPVVLAGMLLAQRRWPSWQLLGWVVVAAISARTVGMGLNRLIDASIDARNPRTKNRELPRKALTPAEGWGVVGLACAAYLFSAARIAPVCLKLSPIPIVLFAIYPLLKRFTWLAHAGLGLAWSLAPVGGWIAVTRSLEGLQEVGWLWLFSLCWVTGFDIIYATLDEAFDRKEGLHSLVVAIGKKPALWVTAVLHAAAWAALFMLWLKQLHNDIALVWLISIGILLIWENRVAAKKPAFAFFQLNGAVGFLVLGFVLSGS